MRPWRGAPPTFLVSITRRSPGRACMATPPTPTELTSVAVEDSDRPRPSVRALAAAHPAGSAAMPAGRPGYVVPVAASVGRGRSNTARDAPVSADDAVG